MNRVMIIGATSAIAEATAREFARRGDRLFLVGRRAEALEAIAVDLRVRGAAQVEVLVQDANDLASQVAMLDAAEAAIGEIDAVLIAYGTLSDQAACQQSVERMLGEMHTNALSQMALCTHLGNRFEARRRGTIAVISSVAGDRGRQSNYVYGSAKAAVSAFTSGLRQRLHKSGVSVVTIKPGFVDTPMTAAFPKGPLWASPAAVGRATARAMTSGRTVVYTPWFWWGIMQIIRNIPEFVFRKLSL